MKDLAVLVIFSLFYGLGVYSGIWYEKQNTQHDLCFDTRTHDAWIAKKGDEMRCFMEQKDYPHRVKASNLENP